MFMTFLYRSETTLNYWMMLDKYSHLKEEVGNSITGCEILVLGFPASYALVLVGQPSVSKNYKI